MDVWDPGGAVLVAERRQLTNVAYRLLGSLTEAEDAVQEAYARWYAMPAARRAAIGSPGAWLTTVAGRICLDVLGSARARREKYVGAWLPEPLPDRTEWGRGGGSGGPDDPADRVVLDDSVNMAFLVVLETMTPAERVAFVLHDVFRYPFAEIAAVVGRTPAACRQLAASGRRRVRGASAAGSAPGTPGDPAGRTGPRGAGGAVAEQARLVREFKVAWEAADVSALVALLDPDAVMTADGGGLVGTVLRPVAGSGPIAQYVRAIADKAPGLVLLERQVNGRPGLVAQHGGMTATVAAFAVTDTHITDIWVIRNPAKLGPWLTP
ncbi:sigma factor [Streptomyces sp. NPDC089919]|uniref:sigma factor n=1 Tax=Streptomyces sp. NPDC089919 TaxID=3155188 RepID=UPI003449DAC4